MALRLARQFGASFVPGTDLVHVWTDDVTSVSARWDRRVVQSGLAPALTPGAEPGHLYAPAYVFLGAGHLQDVLAAPDTDDGENAAAAILLPLALDRGTIGRSYGLYRAIAQERGWVATPALLGRYASYFVGVGKHSRLISLNVGEQTSSAITFAGVNKAYGRELLKAHGFPVAPGGHAMSPAVAVARAEAVGWPVVVKGLSSGNSEAVILGIDDAKNCFEAAEVLIGADASPILVEKMIEGVEVRAHFAAGRLHSVYKATARHVEGDGKKSVLRLLKEGAPDYLNVMLSHPLQQRRLIFQFWQFGVRKVEDLARLIVSAGEKIRVSAATGSGMERLAEGALHPIDVARFEALLQRYGSPSAGIDVMLKSLGTPLQEGGAIIEINCPCGFGYVSDPREVATIELDALVGADSSFLADEGRVPVTIISAEDFAVPERLAQVTRGPNVGVHRASAELGWLPILTDAKDHLVVELDDARVRLMGMPENLRPDLVTWDHARLATTSPHLCATVANAGGQIISR